MKNLNDVFKKLTKSELVSLLYKSLHLMRQYNGRSQEECILLAIGVNEEDDEIVYPTLKEIKENLAW